MPLWLPEAAAKIQPAAVDDLLVRTGLAKSLTEARRLIRDGAVYLNNEKLVPPEPGFLPVIYSPSFPPGVYEWIREALAGGGWPGPPEDGTAAEDAELAPGDLYHGRYALLRKGKRAVAVIEYTDGSSCGGEVGEDPGTGDPSRADRP